ncbi:MAG: hypothetical protein OXC66_04065 [Roseovarius sp.]|nr:hypothetical protein [Roseovarius sp.]
MAGKTAVVSGTDRPMLRGFVRDTAVPGARLNIDTAVNHGVSEYLNGMVYINGMESFWALLKRGYRGTFPHV